MGLKKLKPNTPGQRHKVADTFDDVTKGSPEKSLIAKKKSSGGRNASGKMTVRNIGGGHKKKYRLIDFKRTKLNVPATVKSIEYDPNRTARIALLHYSDGEKAYILAPNGLEVGAKLQAGKGAPIEVGNALPLSEIPLGTVVHNVEFQPGQGGKLARSAGSYVQLIAKEGKYTFISTGMSTMDEIKKVVEIFEKENCPFELMHCNSSYPMENSDANLATMKTLKNTFNCKVGYSGHERGLQVSLAAVALGATSIERHITLDRTMYGSDQSASIEPTGLIHLVRDIRVVETAIGSSEKIVTEKEKQIRSKLAHPYWTSQ